MNLHYLLKQADNGHRFPNLDTQTWIITMDLLLQMVKFIILKFVQWTVKRPCPNYSET